MMDIQDVTDSTVCQDGQDFKEPQDHWQWRSETHQVFQETMDTQERRDTQDFQEIMDFRDHQERPDTQEHQVKTDIQDHQDSLEPQEAVEIKDSRESVDVLDFQDFQEPQDTQELQEDGRHPVDSLSPSTPRPPQCHNVHQEPLNSGKDTLFFMFKETVVPVDKILDNQDPVCRNSTQCHSCSVT